MPTMKLIGEIRHDWPTVLGHMHWPNNPDRAEAMAGLAKEGERLAAVGSLAVDELLRLQSVEIRGGKAGKPLKGKSLPLIGRMAGDVLIRIVQLSQHHPRRASVSLAAHLLECEAQRNGRSPTHADDYRRAFSAFRAASHLWASQNYCVDLIFVSTKRELCSVPSSDEIMEEIQREFGLFLALAETFRIFAEGHIVQDQPLIAENASWRVPSNIQLESANTPKFPAPLEDDLKSYNRRLR